MAQDDRSSCNVTGCMSALMRFERSHSAGSRMVAWTLILALHLLALYGWQHFSRRVGAAGSPSTITMLLLPATPAPRPAKPVASPLIVTLSKRPQISPRAPQAINRPAPSIAPPPSTAASSVTTNVPPEKSDAPAEHDLAATALHDIGSIDKSLRKEFRQLPQREVLSPQARLGSAIASAGVNNRLAPTIRQRTFADGRTVVQVSSSAGTYCVTQKSAGATDGIDHMQNGNAATATDCGHLFD